MRAVIGSNSTAVFSPYILGPMVTVKAVTAAVTQSIKITITPTAPTAGQALVADATGTYADGKPLEFQFYWSRSLDGGKTWEGWNYYGQTLAAGTTASGQAWRVEASGFNQTTWGPYVTGPTVTVK